MKNVLCLLLLLVVSTVNAQTPEELISKALANPGDLSSIGLIQKSGGYAPDYREMRSAFKKLNKKVRKSTQGKIFDRYLKALENSSVGKRAPGITQFDLEGVPYSLADLKGKYVLVEFWASWCPVCRRENPNLVAVYEEFSDKNFEILGVSFDKEFDAWKKAIEDDGLKWKHISDLQGWNSYASQLYGVKAIPQNILVDPEGIVVGRNLREDALRSKLSELLTGSL